VETGRAIARSAAPGLTLPRLGAHVPEEIRTAHDERAAGLAVLLLDAGLLPHELRTSDPGAISSMCEAALRQWVAERTVGMKVLSLTVTVDGVREWNGTPSGSLRFCCYAAEVVQVVCGPVLQQLFRIDPRLPRAVLERTERLAWKAVPLLACSDQLGLAEWLLWGGCQSPEEHAEENELEGEDRTSYLESVVRREDILETCPEWIFEPDGSRTGSIDLAAIAGSTDDPLCCQILTALSALEAMEAPGCLIHDRQQDGGAQFIGFSALLRYSEDDELVFLGEEFGNYAMESGEAYDCVMVDVIPGGDKATFAKWLDGFAAFLTTCRLLDHLLFLLGGSDSDRSASAPTTERGLRARPESGPIAFVGWREWPPPTPESPGPSVPS